MWAICPAQPYIKSSVLSSLLSTCGPDKGQDVDIIISSQPALKHIGHCSNIIPKLTNNRPGIFSYDFPPACHQDIWSGPSHHHLNAEKFFLKGTSGLPGGAVVKNPPANAGDTGSSLGLGRSHMPQSNYASVPQLLSLHSTAHVPQLLSPRATTTEAHAPRAHAPQQEEPPQW